MINKIEFGIRQNTKINKRVKTIRRNDPRPPEKRNLNSLNYIRTKFLVQLNLLVKSVDNYSQNMREKVLHHLHT